MKVHYAFALTALLALVPVVEAKPRNAKAGNLARMLQPGKMDKSAEASHLAEVESRLFAVLSTLEESSRGAGPPPKDLIKQAYEMRNDVSSEYAKLAGSAIHDAWEEASSLGMFTAGGEFSRTITDGPDAGKEAVLQYIVPIKYVPEFSRSFCNVELVSPSKRRVSDDPAKFDSRMIGYGKMLRSYAARRGLARDEEAERQAKRKAEEAKRAKSTPAPRSGQGTLAKNHRERDGRIYGLQRSRAEYEARWNELRKADPGSADRRPNISANIERKSNPSRKSGGRYIQMVSFENRSNFPTEVTIDFCFVGKPGKGPEYVSLLRKTSTVKILPGDSYESQESFSPGKSKYRGYAAVVIFDGEIIASTSSDARMETFTKEGEMDAGLGR